MTDPRRIACSVAVTPFLAFAVGALVNAGVGVGPVDVATLGVAERFDVAVGTGSLLLAVAVAVVASIGGVRPGPATFLGLPVFGPCLTLAVEVAPEPSGIAAVGQFVLAVTIAAGLVAVIVALDAGVGPPEALMLAVERRSRWPVGRVRVVEDVGFTALGLALGASVGVGTLVIALGFGPLVGWFLPRARRTAERVAPHRPAPLLPPAAGPA